MNPALEASSPMTGMFQAFDPSSRNDRRGPWSFVAEYLSIRISPALDHGFISYPVMAGSRTYEWW